MQHRMNHQAIKPFQRKKKLSEISPLEHGFGRLPRTNKKNSQRSTTVFEPARFDGFQMRLDSSRKCGQSMLA